MSTFVRSLILAFMLVACAFLIFASRAMSATVPDAGIATPASVTAPTVLSDPEADPVGFVSALWSAARSAKWLALVGGIIWLLVWATRKWGAKLVPWFRSDRGGVVLAIGSAVLAGVASWLAMGTITLEALVVALVAAGGASGWRSWIKRLISPKDVTPPT